MNIRTTASTLLTTLATAASGQVVIDGLAFIDRATTGEIDLGEHRGGLGVLDFDNDGWPDLVIANEEGSSQRLFRNVEDPLRPGHRTFADATAAAGLGDPESVARNGVGPLAADYDNDGDTDLYFIARLSLDDSFGLLYRNDGGVFTNVSAASGLRACCAHVESASWHDFDLDGYVDLFVFAAGDSQVVRLFRNNGDGAFVERPDLLPAFGNGAATVYAHVWTDIDADGWAECFALTSARAPVALRNIADGAGGRRFVDVGPQIEFDRLGPAPMGVATGDWDNDGDPDVSLSNGEYGVYYRNDGGLMTEVFPFETIWAWGIGWLDADNDGDLDHFQCGSLGQGATLDVLIRNDGAGAWADISGALNGVSAATRQSVQVDFNNDGRRDLIANNPANPIKFVAVYENVSAAPSDGRWLTVRLVGDGERVNRDAIGAVVRVRAGGADQVREVQAGSSTTGTEDFRQHFGLGGASVVDRVEVVWPRRGSLPSRTQVFDGPFAPDQILTLAAPCVGDVDEDGVVGFADLNALLGEFGQSGENLDADFDGDGDVDFPDLNGLLGRYGAGCDAPNRAAAGRSAR